MTRNQKLSRWWCDLNGWDWPDDFPLSPPHNFESMNKKEKLENIKFKIAWLIVKLLTTRKARLRYWNVVRRVDDGKMTPKQFEQWWDEKGHRFY